MPFRLLQSFASLELTCCAGSAARVHSVQSWVEARVYIVLSSIFVMQCRISGRWVWCITPESGSSVTNSQMRPGSGRGTEPLPPLLTSVTPEERASWLSRRCFRTCNAGPTTCRRVIHASHDCKSLLQVDFASSCFESLLQVGSARCCCRSLLLLNAARHRCLVASLLWGQ